jgi:hypothetical protein
MQVDIEAASDQQERLRHAKEFLQDNPNEKPITMARIYALNSSTLYSSLSRPQNPTSKCGS